MKKLHKVFLKGVLEFLTGILYFTIASSIFIGLIFGFNLLGIHIVVSTIVSFLVVGSSIFGLDNIRLEKKYPSHDPK